MDLGVYFSQLRGQPVAIIISWISAGTYLFLTLNWRGFGLMLALLCIGMFVEHKINYSGGS